MEPATFVPLPATTVSATEDAVTVLEKVTEIGVPGGTLVDPGSGLWPLIVSGLVSASEKSTST